MAEDTRTAATRGRMVAVAADVVRWVGLIFALILVLHVILVAGEANPANGIARFIHTIADWVSLGFKDLFNKPADDPKLRVLINYGLAAVFWLAVSATLSRLIRRLA
jgi:hypothetical protein